MYTRKLEEEKKQEVFRAGYERREAQVFFSSFFKTRQMMKALFELVTTAVKAGSVEKEGKKKKKPGLRERMRPKCCGGKRRRRSLTRKGRGS